MKDLFGLTCVIVYDDIHISETNDLEEGSGILEPLSNSDGPWMND